MLETLTQKYVEAKTAAENQQAALAAQKASSQPTTGAAAAPASRKAEAADASSGNKRDFPNARDDSTARPDPKRRCG
jgi:hypothetical protein